MAKSVNTEIKIGSMVVSIPELINEINRLIAKIDGLEKLGDKVPTDYLTAEKNKLAKYKKMLDDRS